MNIFILDQDPEVAARMLCDKHLIKMILESAQMLCSPFEPGQAPYRRTHYNHPCSKWIRESGANYMWLVQHSLAMCDEYSTFYGRVHKSQAVIEWCQQNAGLLESRGRLGTETLLTPFAQAMPDEYRVLGDAVAAYRGYYLSEKAGFAKWERGRQVPYWWNNV